MECKLKACRKCTGDLVLDGDEWRCWQCGRYYYPNPPVLDVPTYSQEAERPPSAIGLIAAVRGRGRRRAPRDINSVIAAKDRSESRWRNRNQDVIRYLNEGRTVREISAIIGRGQRQIRVIRERLSDLRASEVGELSTA